MSKNKIHTTVIVTKNSSLYPYVFDDSGKAKSKADIIKGIIHADDYITGLAVRKHIVTGDEIINAIQKEIAEAKDEKTN